MREDLLDGLLQSKRVIRRQISYNEYDYYGLDSVIERVEDFIDLFETLKQAQPNDIVRLYIDCDGGSVSVGSMIIAHIQEAMNRGVVVLANIGMNTASMASAIALACTDLEINPYSQMLIHSWQSMSGGNSNDILRDGIFQHKESERYLRFHYTNFLTEDEILECLKYKTDLQFSAEEIASRWEQKLKIEDALPEEPTIDLDALIANKVKDTLTDLGYAVPAKTVKKKNTTH